MGPLVGGLVSGKLNHSSLKVKRPFHRDSDLCLQTPNLSWGSEVKQQRHPLATQYRGLRGSIPVEVLGGPLSTDAAAPVPSMWSWWSHGSVSGHGAVCIRKHSVPSSMTSDKSLSTSTPKARIFCKLPGQPWEGCARSRCSHSASGAIHVDEGHGGGAKAERRALLTGSLPLVVKERIHMIKHTGGDHKSSMDCR